MKILIDHRIKTKPTGKHIYTQSLIVSLKAMGHQVVLHQDTTPFQLLRFRQCSNKVDLTIGSLSFLSPLIAQPPVITVVYDLAVFHQEFTPNTKAHLIETATLKSVLKKSTKIITISHAINNEIACIYPSITAKLTLINPTVNKIPSSLPFPKDIPQEPFILFLGTLEPRKNHLRLIKAYQQSFNYEPQMPNLIIAGSPGWQEVSILKAIKKAPQKKVIYINRVSLVQKQRLLRHMRFLAFPSLYEGFGLPVLEAIAAGKASLISQDPALREVAGSTGLSTRATDIHELSRSLLRLTFDHQFRSKLESKTSSRLAEYTQKIQQSQLQSLLRDFKT